MTLKHSTMSVDRLTKIFRVYAHPLDRLREVLSRGKRSYHVDFWALRDISFDVPRGATVGIVGQNGSGKSTLLKILGRLMLPSSGRLEIQGRVSSLIELGTGFHGEFTGRSNVMLSASLMGLSEDEIESRFASILEFSGLADFIDRPLKTYSSGMWVRLAFATAICIDPEVLLIDEALAVGDTLFQQKCIRKLRQFQENGATILFVSHDMSAVRTLCDRVLLLDRGSIVADGSPARTTEEYIALLAQRGAQDSLVFRTREVTEQGGKQPRRYGSFAAEVTGVELLNARGESITAAVSGDECTIRVRVLFHQPMENPTVGILIRDRLGNDVFGTNTYHHSCQVEAGAGDVLTVDFKMAMRVGAGEYFLTVAVHSDRDHFSECRDWIDNVMSFQILPTLPEFVGIARLDPVVSVAHARPMKPAGVAKIG